MIRLFLLVLALVCSSIATHDEVPDDDLDKAVQVLSSYASVLDSDPDAISPRFRRDADGGVTHLDIRDAILQLLKVIRDSSKSVDRHDRTMKETTKEILKRVKAIGTGGGGGGGNTKSIERKIDNISTFLLRMNSKLDQIDRSIKRGGRSQVLETLAQESYDILTVIPTYIENTKEDIGKLKTITDEKFKVVEGLLVDGEGEGEEGDKKSLAKVLKAAESNILTASSELKDVVIESGHMAENLFEMVTDGYKELSKDIKGFANVEQVLLDTADSVIDTKKKIEFGVKQIIYKIGELVKLSGGKVDDQLRDQFEDITRTILENQNEALGNLTTKVEKEIGQVWRQMGIMYNQVSSSISILEKVKTQTEGYVNNTGKNLGTMEGQVEGLTDRMVDVDQNLNYMLGQLSLVVQEFNQVKTGLGEAITGLGDELEDIKEYKPEDASSDSEG